MPKSEIAQQHLNSSGSILLDQTTVRLTRDLKFSLEFQCEYDPTKASNDQFDKLCNGGLIVVGAEVDAEEQDISIYWLKSGVKKLEQNIK